MNAHPLASYRRASGLLTLLTLLAVCSSATGQQPRLPAKVSIPPNRLTQLVIETGGVQTKWKLFGADIDSFREYDPDPSRIVLRLIGYKEGTAYCLAWGAKGDVPSEGALCVITVGTPEPPPPDPTDPLAFSLSSAFKSESDAKKGEYVAYLAAICEGMPSKVDAATTVGDLFSTFSTVLHAEGLGIPKGALPLVMRVVGDALNKALGTDPAKAIDKPAAKDAFGKLARALKGVR